MIDNLSWSAALGCGRRPKKRVKLESLNGHTTLHESIQHDHLDKLALVIKMFVAFGSIPCLWKVSVDGISPSLHTSSGGVFCEGRCRCCISTHPVAA